MRRNVLVTGETLGNRGIGKAVVAQLAKQNKENRVILVARDENSGRSALEDINAHGVNNVEMELCDVGNEDSIRKMGERLRAKEDKIEVIINNAGIGWNVLGGDLSTEFAQELMRVNYYGPLLMTKYLSELLPTTAGKIIHVSSEAGVLKKPRYSRRVYDGINRATTVEELNSLASDFKNSVGVFHRTKKDQEWPIDAYRSSKALLNGLARVQASQFRERGIFVASVCPGWVRTRMGGEAAPRSPDEGADTITWLATENLELADSGKFWQDRNVIKAAI